jgi:F0F1-type ATP synthase membrane subunit a
MFTGGVLVLALIYILLKYTLGLMLIILNLVLLFLCWLYETVTRKHTPTPVVNLIEQIEAFTTKMTTASSKSSDNYNYSDHYHDNADDF